MVVTTEDTKETTATGELDHIAADFKQIQFRKKYCILPSASARHDVQRRARLER